MASSLEALLVALEERVELDYAQTDSVVASLPPIDPRATPYRGVHRLLSGERVALGSRAEPISAAGCGDTLENLEGSDDELADALWKAAYEAVARAAKGVRVLGVLAGGGVDSSGLLAAAVAHAKDRGDLQIVPLAIDFAARGDDRPHLRAAAAWLGVEPVRIAPEEAAPYLRASLIVDARPSLEATLALLAAAAVAAKARGVEVIITGFLGDLILDAPAGATLARARAAGSVEKLRAVIAAGRHRDSFATSSSRLVWQRRGRAAAFRVRRRVRSSRRGGVAPTPPPCLGPVRACSASSPSAQSTFQRPPRSALPPGVMPRSPPMRRCWSRSRRGRRSSTSRACLFPSRGWMPSFAAPSPAFRPGGSGPVTVTAASSATRCAGASPTVSVSALTRR